MREIDIPTLLAAMALLPAGDRSVVEDRAVVGTRFLRSISARAVVEAQVGTVDRRAQRAAPDSRA